MLIEEGLSTILIDLVNNDITGAKNIASRMCSSQISSIQQIGCQIQNNLKNGLTLYSSDTNNVASLNWKVYDSNTDANIDLIENFETSISQYQNDIHHEAALLNLANNAISKSVQEIAVWNLAISNTQSTMDFMLSQLYSLRKQMTNEMYAIEDDFNELIHDINNAILEINQKIDSINSSTFFDDMFDIIEVVGGAVLCCFGMPAEAYVVSNTIDLVGDVFNTLDAADQVAALQQAIVKLQGSVSNLEHIETSFYSLDSIFSEINATSSLPDILPAVQLAEVGVAELNEFTDNLAKALSSNGDVKHLEVDVQNLSSFTKSFIQLTVNWYALAMKLQTYAAQVSVIEYQSNTLSQEVSAGTLDF